MAKVSISRAWEESREVLAQDGKLIGAVALALFVLPGLIFNLFVPTDRQPGPWMLVVVVAMLVTLVGQLSVIRLAMGPHVSVGEAIGHGARRILPLLGALFLWVVPFLIVGSVLSGLIGKDLEHPNPAAVLGLVLLTAIGMFLAVRLMLTSVVASAEPVGPLAILRRSWELSKGNWWRLFGFLMLVVIVLLVLLFAVQAIFGLGAKMAFGDIAPRTIGGLIVSLAGQLVSAVAAVIFCVMLARIYVELAGMGEAEVSVPSSGT